jgi:hypothetical protein
LTFHGGNDFEMVFACIRNDANLSKSIFIAEKEERKKRFAGLQKN